jgi:hypothetical protein
MRSSPGAHGRYLSDEVWFGSHFLFSLSLPSVRNSEPQVPFFARTHDSYPSAWIIYRLHRGEMRVQSIQILHHRLKLWLFCALTLVSDVCNERILNSTHPAPCGVSFLSYSCLNF